MPVLQAAHMWPLQTLVASVVRLRGLDMDQNGGNKMQILINLAVLAVALAVVATLACLAAGRDGR